MKSSDYSVPLLLLFAFIGWAWCGAVMAAGPLFLSMTMTLILHAILGPTGFGLLSVFYYKSYTRPKPLGLALIFLCFVIVLDAGLVAPAFVKSYAMFQNMLGTWLPFSLIFLCTWFTGSWVQKNRES